MKPDSKLMDDLARMAGGAAGLLSSVRQQLTDDAKDRVDSFIARMDLPTRKEFNFLQAQIKSLRAEIDSLKLKSVKGAKGTTPKSSKVKTTKPKKKAKK